MKSYRPSHHNSLLRIWKFYYDHGYAQAKRDLLCEDCISRAEALKHSHIEYDDDGEGHRVVYAEDIENLPSVTPERKWIPVKLRPLTDEEQKEVPDYCCMADCPMPDDGEEILVTTKYGIVEKDECGFDDGYYLDSGYDWQTDIAAWMPLPEPYKAEREDKE